MARRRGETNLTHSQINAGDEFFDVCCNPCRKKSLNNEGAKYCTSCEEYLCTSCVMHHNTFEKLSKHTLVDPHAKLPPSRRSRSSLQVVPTEMCKKHHLKLVDMYCKDDDKVGCSVCMTLEHKSCVHQYYIPEYVLSNSPSGQLHQVTNDLTKAIQAMSKLKTEQDGLGNDLDKSKAACKQEIQNYRNDINQIIDTIEATTLTDLEARHKDTKKKVNGTNQKIQDIHQEMVRCKSEIESDQSNDSQKFVIAKLSKSTISIGQELKSELVHEQITPITFSRNTDIMTFLLSIVTLGMLCPSGTTSRQQSQAVKYPSKKTQSAPTPPTPPTAGDNKINDKSDPKIVKRTLKTKEQHTTSAKQPLKQGLYKVSDQTMFNLGHPDDEYDTCSIKSVCILDNGDILLADFKNRKLKLVDSTTYAIKSSLALSAYPMSVCRVNSTQAAVGLGNSTVQFISTSNDLELLHSFKTKYSSCHVATIRDIICVGDHKAVYMYTMDGRLVNTVRMDKSGQDMFSCITDITVSEENMIHVSDRDHGVITLNTEGDVVWTYSKGRQLCNASGLCTDEYSNVIVCDINSKTVIQLSQGGLYMGQIVTPGHGIKCPYSVCYDRRKHKLFVSGYNTGNVTAFTLQ